MRPARAKRRAASASCTGLPLSSLRLPAAEERRERIEAILPKIDQNDSSEGDVGDVGEEVGEGNEENTSQG